MLSAIVFWDNPTLTAETSLSLLNFAQTVLPATMSSSQQKSYRAGRQNALRQLVAASPDMQVS
jgi:hypothetical protein